MIYFKIIKKQVQTVHWKILLFYNKTKLPRREIKRFFKKYTIKDINEEPPNKFPFL